MKCREFIQKAGVATGTLITAISNGWIEYSGLHGIPAKERVRIIRDIESLL